MPSPLRPGEGGERTTAAATIVGGGTPAALNSEDWGEIDIVDDWVNLTVI
jgi:hypothetical protein